eukprot:24426-Prorocentrum_minimum.AAC.1
MPHVSEEDVVQLRRGRPVCFVGHAAVSAVPPEKVRDFGRQVRVVHAVGLCRCYEASVEVSQGGTVDGANAAVILGVDVDHRLLITQ